MFSKLLKRRPAIETPQEPSVPEGMVVWAIGDIHGRPDLLLPLLDAIEHEAANSRERQVVVFLGDYVDRGPDSKGVLQVLSRLSSSPTLEWRFLKGNHEQAMLNFMEDPSFGLEWMQYGGVETIASYGLRLPDLRHKPEAWNHLSADLAHRLGSVERAFLENLELSASIGDYFFCHAGARPGQPLTDQSDEDLMWIRRSFLDSDVGFEKIVVHGHTPVKDVYLDHRRIGVDTKAYESGVLSALKLSGRSQSIMVCTDGKVAPGASVADLRRRQAA